MKSFIAWQLLIIFFLIIGYSPAEAGRPLATEDAGIVDIGKWEIESGYTLTNPRGGGASTSQTGLQIKRGILPNFDFAIEFPYQITSPSGLQDIVLHGKYKFLGDEETGWAIRADIKLTNGEQASGLGSGYPDYTLFLINTSKLGVFSIHSNLLYTFVGVAPGGPNANYAQASIAGEYPTLGEKLNIVSEIVWDNSTSPNPLKILLGGYYQILEGLRIDTGLTLGLTDTTDQNVITVGLTKEL